MNNAKRPNLKEVVSLSPSPYGGGSAGLAQGGSTTPGGNPSLHSTHGAENLRKGAGSQLAMAGSMNILSGQNANIAAADRLEADEERLKKVMSNMEKDKSLQFRQNTNNRGYGFQ